MPNPKVFFKRGLQSALPSTSATVVDGAFYLTTDTNRLYVGTESHELRLLNQTVQIVNAIANLPSFPAGTEGSHVNDFYYCTNENVLCVWKENVNGNPYGWQQINKNSDTTLTTATATVAMSNGIASISSHLFDSNSTTFTSHFDIQGEKGIVISAATATTPGVLISGNEYSISRAVANNAATIKLSSTNLPSTTSGFELKAGDNITITEAGTNQVVIKSENTTLTTAVLSLGNDGSVNLLIGDSNEDSVTAVLSNVGVVLENGSYVPLGSTTSGSVQGEIYSKAQIDNMLKGLDGMTYKGTLGSGGTVATLPTTANHVSVGDTYVVVQGGLNSSTVGGSIQGPAFTSTVVGDMFIAVGTEEDGEITSNLQWTYVPSGNDSLDQVTYSVTATVANNTINIKNANDEGVFGITLEASTGIAISSTMGDAISAGDNARLIASISHATVNTTTSTSSNDSSEEFTAVSGLTISNGHVTAIETKTFTPRSYTFSATRSASVLVNSDVLDGTRVATATNAGLNDLTVATTLYTSDDDTIASSIMKLSSETIKLSKGAAGEVIMDMEWGSF